MRHYLANRSRCRCDCSLHSVAATLCRYGSLTTTIAPAQRRVQRQAAATRDANAAPFQTQYPVVPVSAQRGKQRRHWKFAFPRQDIRIAGRLLCTGDAILDVDMPHVIAHYGPGADGIRTALAPGVMGIPQHLALHVIVQKPEEVLFDRKRVVGLDGDIDFPAVVGT